MCICGEVGVFELRDPGPWLKAARDCTNAAHEKGGQKWESGLEKEKLYWRHNLGRVHESTCHVLMKREKPHSEMLLLSEARHVHTSTTFQNLTFYTIDNFLNKAMSFPDFRLVGITAWSNFSNAGIASWQKDLLVLDRPPNEICIYSKECHYAEAPVLYFTLLRRDKHRIWAIVNKTGSGVRNCLGLGTDSGFYCGSLNN